MTLFQAYAAQKPGGPLSPFEYSPGPLGPEEVEIEVHACGICHSDLSMLNNDWQMTRYPLVPGHEVVGMVAALGESAKGVSVGQRVGLGWYSRSCMSCSACMRGDHNLCADGESTIVGRHGGFADRVRCHWSWAVPLPEGLNLDAAGPLFCGGITVFSPLLRAGVRPVDHVGVVGIGGLGHLALKFLRHWGCEVTAFSSSPDKTEELRALGAHHVLSSGDGSALERAAGSLDFLLVTVNVPMDWERLLATLRPGGRLHLVGGVLEPIPVPAMALIVGRRAISGSPLGSPAETAQMLAFCARHQILPQIETFPMAGVNDALAHLRAGKARYRVVLKNV